MLRKLLPLALLFSLGVLLFGCSSDGGDNGTTPVEVDPPRLVAAYHQDPGITSVNSVVWDTIDTIYFAVGTSSSSDYNANVGYRDNLYAAMQALYTDEYLYIKVSWNDNGADTMFFPWKSYLYSDIVHWEAVDTLQVANEDRFYIMFDRGGAEGVDCSQMCHSSSDTSTAGRQFYASTDINGADTWHWKACRTAFAKRAEDMHVTDINISPDPQNSNPGDNLYFRNQVADQPRPIYMHHTDTAYHGAVLLETDAVDMVFTALDNDLEWVEIVANPPDVDSISKYIPGYYIRDSTGNDGSRWDVETVSEYDGTNWTLVLRRLLDSDDNEDLDFDFSVTDSLLIAIALADNSGREHYGLAPFYFIIEK